MTDIVSFFSSIPVPRLVECIYERTGKTMIAERLAQLLEAWDRISDRGGLLMRANASSILASMYLRPIDDLLLAYGKSIAKGPLGRIIFPSGTAVRWVDDIWLFGNERVDMRVAQLELQEVMRSLGLNMNLAKTDVLEGDEMVARARQLEHSAVEVALQADEPDFQPLEQLIESIVTKAEHASHTTIKFATVRMRRHSRYEKVDDLIAVAPRMPHGSDALARVFRYSGKSRDLGDWFAEYLNSKWAKLDLASASFAMMFPASASPPSAVTSAIERRLTSVCTLPLLAIGMQRLANWQPNEARALFRELSRRADNPHERRVIALAALEAGESRVWVANLLREFRENSVTLQYLEARNFARVKSKAEFIGY